MKTLTEIWDSMKRGSRLTAAIFASLIILAAIGAGVWALSERYEILFSSLDPQDAAGAIAELKRMGVEYRIDEGGTRISVPANEVYETRVKLMGSGVPLRGGVGFEIFDEAGFGMTEFTQKINYQRALEGELARTISSLKEVKYARVHLVMPETSLFRKEQTQPSASVTLFMKTGTNVNERRILGIQRLVAAGVSGLETKNVTVTDENGITLSGKGQEDEGNSIRSRLQTKHDIETYLGKKVMEILDRAIGPGRATVSVDVSLNMDQVKTTREEIIPHATLEGEVLRRRESKSNEGQSAGKKGNVVTEVEYLLGHKVEQVVEAPGAIERLSIGVLLPEEVVDDKVEEIRTLVAMSVGLNNARGDGIAVFRRDFQFVDKQGPTPPKEAPEKPVESRLTSEDGPPAKKQSVSLFDQDGWFGYEKSVFALLIVALLALASLFVALRSRHGRLPPEERARMLERLERWMMPGTVIEKDRI